MRPIRTFLKIAVAIFVALLAGTGISTATGLIKPQAFALTGAIFFLVLTVWSRRLERKHKYGVVVVVMVTAWMMLKLTGFPGFARVEDAGGAYVNNLALQAAYKIEMPVSVPCKEPFLDPRSGEPVRWYLIRHATFECYDNEGIIGGEDLRPVTRDIAYIITKRKDVHSKAEPKIEERLVRIKQYWSAMTDARIRESTALAEIEKAKREQERYRELQRGLRSDPVPAAPVHTGAIDCNRDTWTRATCAELAR